MHKDPWYPIRPMIDLFNNCRGKILTPGTHLVVDEIMSAWNGKELKNAVEGMPQVSKIQRKPEGIGAEMKALCDSDTGIIMGLDIMEGKTRQQEKPYHAEFGEGTAVLLRLCKKYNGSGRVVHADSAFSSVKTLLALRERGLFFMGMVKTASKEYPKAYFRQYEAEGNNGGPPLRGSHKLLVSGEPPFYALSWFDRKAKHIITNVGTTNDAEPSRRKRHKVVNKRGIHVTKVWEKVVSRPDMIKLFFDHFSDIDVHDHRRQGSLAFEREWYTHSWYVRIFSTVLGVCVVDAYLLYKYDMKDAVDEPVSFKEFIGALAYELIFNTFLEHRLSRNAGNGRDEGESGSDDEVRNFFFRSKFPS